MNCTIVTSSWVKVDFRLTGMALHLTSSDSYAIWHDVDNKVALLLTLDKLSFRNVLRDTRLEEMN